MVRDIDDIADDRTRGLQSGGDRYHDTFLITRPRAEWSPYIDETAKDLSAGIQIEDYNISKDNFGREVGAYYREGLEETAGRYADLPDVLRERVSDEKLGLLVYQLNEFSYEITTSGLDVGKVHEATEAVLEKLLTRYVGEDLSVSFELDGGTISDVTTALFESETIASNVDVLLDELEESASRGLLQLLDEPQMMTPLWDHQRVALQRWVANDRRGYVDMATATGKTVLGLAAIALKYGELHPEDDEVEGATTRADVGGGDDVLVVAHNDLILEQWRREFDRHLNIPEERTSGDDDIALEWGTVHFRTPQRLVNEDRLGYDLVLLDEAHHYATGSEWGSILDELDGDVLALSGSVDDAGSDSDRIQERLSNSIGPEVKRYTITEARADGVIPSFDWEVRYAPYDVVDDDFTKITGRCEREFDGFQRDLNREVIDVDTDRRLRTYEDVRRFSHTTEGRDLKQEHEDFGELTTRLFSRRTTRWNLSPILDSVVELVLDECQTENVVVLADSNAQVEALEDRLREVVPSATPVYSVSRSQGGDEQHDTIGAFDDPERAGVLLGTGDLLGEGVDMQHASVAINMATGSVNSELVQRIGRVLRNPADDPKHAMFYNVVGVPPTEVSAVPREDGMRTLEEAARFCTLGGRFEKLPGFSTSNSLDESVLDRLLEAGAEFVAELDATDEFQWDRDTIEGAHLSALHEAVRSDEDLDTILGEWEEYAWERSSDDGTTAEGDAAIDTSTDPDTSGDDGSTKTEVASDSGEPSDPPSERSSESDTVEWEEIDEDALDSEDTETADADEETAADDGSWSDADAPDDTEPPTSDPDGSPDRKWNSRERALLDELHRLDDVLDDTPSKLDVQIEGDYPMTDYEDTFGTWVEAVRAGGMEPRESDLEAEETDADPRYIRQDVIDGLRAVAAKLDKPPTVDDVEEHAPFDSDAVYDYFDSFFDARVAADVDYVVDDLEVESRIELESDSDDDGEGEDGDEPESRTQNGDGEKTSRDTTVEDADEDPSEEISTTPLESFLDDINAGSSARTDVESTVRDAFDRVSELLALYDEGTLETASDETASAAVEAEITSEVIQARWTVADILALSTDGFSPDPPEVATIFEEARRYAPDVFERIEMSDGEVAVTASDSLDGGTSAEGDTTGESDSNSGSDSNDDSTAGTDQSPAREDLLDELAAIYDTTGRVPTRSDVIEDGDYSIESYDELFHSLDSAVEQCQAIPATSDAGTSSSSEDETNPDAEPETDSEGGSSFFWDTDAEAITDYDEDPVPTDGETGDGDPLDEKIDEWKSQLLDLTRRNDLVSFGATKTKSLPFVDADPTTVAEVLDGGQELYVRKRPEAEGTVVPVDEVSEVDRRELLPTRVPEEATHSLGEIGRRNKQYIRERGVDTLYVSLGMLRWYDVDHSDDVNRSPVFLAPVELVERPQQDEHRHDYVLEPKSEEIHLNPALRKKLAAERGLRFPPDGALTLGDIDAAFQSVYETVRGYERWTLQDDVVLGIFDFTKYSLFTDLERNRSVVKNDPIVRALTDDVDSLREAEGEIETPSADELDDVVDPTETYQVLDADSSQQEAIEAAKAGKSFVLQGPPGTGKSQTIANVIAEKLADGERVLFVSEKQAALDVVKERLDEVGIGRFCLEVHGEKARKDEVLSHLESELSRGETAPAPDRTERLRRLRQRRDTLNEYGDHLFYSPDGWDLTAYQALGKVSEHAQAPYVPVDIGELTDLNQAEVEAAVDALETLAVFEDQFEAYETSPWRHTTLTRWGIDTGERMRRSLERQSQAVERLAEVADDLDTVLGTCPDSLAEFRTATRLVEHLEARPSVEWHESLFTASFVHSRDDLSELVELERERAALLSELSEKYDDSFGSLEGAELAEELAQYGFLKRLKPSYRSLTADLTDRTTDDYDPGYEQLLNDVETLAELQRIEERREEYRELIETLGPSYDGSDTDWETVVEVRSWVDELGEFPDSYTEVVVERLLDGTLPSVEPHAERAARVLDTYDDAASVFEESMAVDDMTIDGRSLREAPLSVLVDELESLADHVPALQRRVEFSAQLERVRDSICGEYVDRFLAEDHDPDHLVPAFERRFYTVWLDDVYESTSLDSFNTDEMERYVEEFRRLDDAQRELAAQEIRHRVSRRQPSSSLGGQSSSDRALVRRQIERQRRRKPLRELFEEAGSFVSELTPCFMMSPLSVAQYLKIDSIQFDTVVFDEASQILPQDAISSLIRADQAIVAGDTKQLPPTSFFQSDVETTENVREDLDSILEETATILPEKHLRWHYRSRSKELIEFSNHYYYDGSLRTFPENEPDVTTGVSFEYVPDGIYDRGGSRQNEVEARRVVDLIEEHAEERSEKSLGVVAFSSAQEQAIRDVIEERRQENAVLDGFVDQDDVLDEFFVKNLEMVQGDERDRMIFSVGYGPTREGTVYMNFGPLNNSGGERRLNVAVTRAREQVTVVSSLEPEEIDLSRTRSTGVEHFKKYLEYARDGEQTLARDRTVTGTLDFDSSFEEAVYDALTDAGYDVVSQLQSANYSIDLAIRHPDRRGEFVLGIECDGAAYHSSKTARDRDRTRQMVLEDLGWTIHRIWSPDWASNRERELEKIEQRVASLVEDAEDRGGDLDGTETTASEAADTDGGDSDLRDEDRTDASFEIRRETHDRYGNGNGAEDRTPDRSASDHTEQQRFEELETLFESHTNRAFARNRWIDVAFRHDGETETYYEYLDGVHTLGSLSSEQRDVVRKVASDRGLSVETEGADQLRLQSSGETQTPRSEARLCCELLEAVYDVTLAEVSSAAEHGRGHEAW